MKEKILKLLSRYLDSCEEIENKKLVDFDKNHEIVIEEYTCLCRELTWKEASHIDYDSYCKSGNNYYLSSEKEKRLIVEKSLISIKDKNNNIVDADTTNLDFNFVEKYWSEYQKYLHLTLDEVNSIYLSSKKYFDPSNNDRYPIHPMIIQVDYMTKGIVHLTKNEFENLSVKEFEAIQIILATKNEK